MSYEIYINLEDSTEEESEKFSVSSGLFVSAVITADQIPEDIDIGFDFNIFDKIYDYLETDKKKYKEQKLRWTPEEVEKIFGDLKQAILKNIDKLPSFYWLRTTDKKENRNWSGVNSGHVVVDGIDWYISGGWNNATAKSKEYGEFDLLKDDSLFKINYIYPCTFPDDSKKRKLFFKIEPSNFYENFKYIFKTIFEMCEYAKKHNRQIHMSIG